MHVWSTFTPSKFNGRASWLSPDQYAHTMTYFPFLFFFAKYFVYRTLINYAKLRILITYRTEWPKSHLAAESPCQLILSHSVYHVTGLTLTLLTCTKWRAPTNASKWRMGFNPYPANVDKMASSYQC